jgi:hypothetical protein
MKNSVCVRECGAIFQFHTQTPSHLPSGVGREKLDERNTKKSLIEMNQ